MGMKKAVCPVPPSSRDKNTFRAKDFSCSVLLFYFKNLSGLEGGPWLLTCACLLARLVSSWALPQRAGPGEESKSRKWIGRVEVNWFSFLMYKHTWELGSVCWTMLHSYWTSLQESLIDGWGPFAELTELAWFYYGPFKSSSYLG